MRKIEILSPAGSINSMKAAINAGCDAIYIGGRMFGARAFADNPDTDEMIESIKYAHLYGKKIYITVNTLLKNDEIYLRLYDYLKPYYEAGVDAVIVQDVGVMKFIHEEFDNLPIHASTQMTIMTGYSAEFLKEYGITRIVTPRELNLDEIRHMKKNTGLEIETFVHGALCYCYSGQCLLSSMIGGRSGNRGKCAQPCRKLYSIDNAEKSYKLSPKDLCTLRMIPELADSGIDSFKIEGRMKKPEYCAIVTALYKKYTDLYCTLGKSEYENYCINNPEELDNDITRLMDIYNRGGFTDGFFLRHNGPIIMSQDRPNHYGTCVGYTTKVDNNKCSIRLTKDVYPHDVLEIRGSNENDTYEYTLKNGCSNGNTIQTLFSKGKKITNKQMVYRIRNQELIDEIYNKYIDTQKKIKLIANFKACFGEKMELKLSTVDSYSYNKKVSVTVLGDVVLEAQNKAISEESIIKQLKKTGNTEFEIETIELNCDDNIFIPVSCLNNLRRMAIEELKGEIYKINYRSIDTNNSKLEKKVDIDSYSDSKMNINEKHIAISVTDINMLDVVMNYEFFDRLMIDITELSYEDIVCAVSKVNARYGDSVKIFIILPRIMREKDIDLFEREYLNLFNIDELSGFVIRNLESLYLIKKYDKRNLIIISDYNMYAMNSMAADTYKNMGIDEISTSEELTYDELIEQHVSRQNTKIYGYTTVMVSAGCINYNTGKCDKKSHNIIIKDSYDDKYTVKNICRYCYNIMYNSKPTNYLNKLKEIITYSLRVDFTIENSDEIMYVMDCINRK